LSYWPKNGKARELPRLTRCILLLGLAVYRVFAAARAVLFDFHTTWIVAAVFLRGVIALLAIATGKSDHRTNIFLFRSHNFTIQSTRKLWQAVLY